MMGIILSPLLFQAQLTVTGQISYMGDWSQLYLLPHDVAAGTQCWLFGDEYMANDRACKFALPVFFVFIGSTLLQQFAHIQVLKVSYANTARLLFFYLIDDI